VKGRNPILEDLAVVNTIGLLDMYAGHHDITPTLDDMLAMFDFALELG
jgi:hypothetical protein